MTYQPRSRLVKRFPLLILVSHFLRLWHKQIKVRGNPDRVAGSVHVKCGMLSDKPNRKTDIQPTTIFLPAFSRHTVGIEEDISLAQLDRFPAVYERISGRMPREMHRNRIYLGFFPIVSGGDSAH